MAAGVPVRRAGLRRRLLRSRTDRRRRQQRAQQCADRHRALHGHLHHDGHAGVHHVRQQCVAARLRAGHLGADLRKPDQAPRLPGRTHPGSDLRQPGGLPDHRAGHLPGAVHALGGQGPRRPGFAGQLRLDLHLDRAAQRVVHHRPVVAAGGADALDPVGLHRPGRLLRAVWRECVAAERYRQRLDRHVDRATGHARARSHGPLLGRRAEQHPPARGGGLPAGQPCPVAGGGRRLVHRHLRSVPHRAYRQWAQALGPSPGCGQRRCAAAGGDHRTARAPPLQRGNRLAPVRAPGAL
ncbi:hypothetical protein D3C71_997640 [compost metagenome]